MRALNEQELKLIHDNVPEFVALIDEANKEGVGEVKMMIDAFGGTSEAVLLQNVIWYASKHGVAVTFIAENV